MSRIIVQSFVWNTSQFIAAPIMAIHKYVDEIQIFDGAWKGYPIAKVPWSTDGTEEVVKSLKLACSLKWFPCEEFYESQVAKKIFMLKYWHPGEWRYLMGDDEIPVGNLKSAFARVREEKKALIGYVPMVEIQPNPLSMKHLGLKPRFFRWQKGFHYGKRGGVLRHNLILNAKNMFRDKWPHIELKEMLLVHLKYLRHLERREAQLKYQKTPH